MGIDGLLAQPARWLRGPKVALLANMASLTGSGQSTLEALRRAPGVELRALFTPEHGWSGFEEDATPIGDRRDPRSGLPLHSLYGPRRRPSPEALAGLDAVVVDVQEVGVRCYTYGTTLALLLEAARESGTQVVVCDRPNLLGPRVDGPALDPALRSFLGYLPLPYQHGLTLGELGRWTAEVLLQGAVELQVVPMQGWRRGDPPPMPWVPPSPGLPSEAAVQLYPGLVLLEGFNLSEGRGTTLPFQLLGAPWLEAYALAEALDGLALPGLRFRPLWFKPESGRYRGEVCQGVQLLVHDPAALRPLTDVIAILRLLRGLHPQLAHVQAEDLPWSREPGAGEPWHEPVRGPLVDGLMGSRGVREVIDGQHGIEALLPAWRSSGQRFVEEVHDLLLYPGDPLALPR